MTVLIDTNVAQDMLNRLKHYNSKKSCETPKAYKTLMEEGSSPWLQDSDWSLPQKAQDGSWIPGEWKCFDWTQQPNNDGPPIPQESGLYVGKSPLLQPNARYFEAEIGDLKSRELFAKARNHEWFPAQKVRLTRELTAEEVRDLRSMRL